MLSGWAGSGKDTVAKYMDTFQRLAFADKLKQDVSAETGIPIEDFHTSAKDVPRNSVTPRSLLLKHAFEAKEKDPYIYVRHVARLSKEHENVVITDWRYKEEYAFLAANTSARVIRIRVTRDLVPSTHPSEHDLDDEPFDYFIHNTGSMESLRASVNQMVESFAMWNFYYDNGYLRP
jgi:cytidylate kinase